MQPGLRMQADLYQFCSYIYNNLIIQKKPELFIYYAAQITLLFFKLHWYVCVLAQ